MMHEAVETNNLGRTWVDGLVEGACSITAPSRVPTWVADFVPAYDVTCRKCHPQTGATLNRDTPEVLRISILSLEMKGVLGYGTETRPQVTS